MPTERSGRVPFSYFDAAFWSAGSTFAFILVLQAAIDAKPEYANDLVLLGGLQVLVYVAVCALFAWRRQGKSFGELFGLRGTSPLLLVLAVLLGVLLHGPAGTVSDLMERLAPLPPEMEQAFRERLAVKSVSQGVALFVVAAVAGPFVEELLYRGAIFTSLRPVHGAVGAVFASSLCFTVSHFESRQWPPILLLGCALGLARGLSGSMWASTLVHAAFNATTLALVLAPRARGLESLLAHELYAWAACVGVFALFVWVARKSPRASLARAGDLPLAAPLAPSGDDS